MYATRIHGTRLSAPTLGALFDAIRLYLQAAGGIAGFIIIDACGQMLERGL